MRSSRTTPRPAASSGTGPKGDGCPQRGPRKGNRHDGEMSLNRVRVARSFSVMALYRVIQSRRRLLLASAGVPV